MKNILFIFILILTISFLVNCNENKSNLLEVDKNLKIDSTFVKAFRYNKGEIYIDSIKIAVSYYINDTIIISLADPYGFPIELEIIYSNNNCESYIKMWSDYPQYEGKFSTKRKTKPEYLVLNNLKYELNDTILGIIKTKNVIINDKDFPFDSIMFQGKFFSILR